MKFQPIEGLRAWLAWSVVLSHCILLTGLNDAGVMKRIWYAGDIAVLVFIIISGFVITHMVLTKRDRYSTYIKLRFFRIFPLFAAATVAGIFTLPQLQNAAHSFVWSINQGPSSIDPLISSQREHVLSHLILHALMLHGAVSNAILPYSQYAFVPPGWSLSLEWQFYLVAPFVIVSKRKLIWLIAAVFLYVLYADGKLGSFVLPSFLPGASLFFGVGIASRLFFDKLPSVNSLVALSFLVVVPFFNDGIRAVLLWCAFMVFLKASQCNSFQRLFELAFSTRCVLFWGERSYSVYLTHFSVLSGVLSALSYFPELSRWQVFAALVPLSVMATACVSLLTFKFVERPMIRFSKKASRTMPPHSSTERTAEAN